LILSKSPKLYLVVFLAVATARAAEKEFSMQALQGLVEAERNFARAAVEHGIRDSFLQFLADDSVVFAPGPTNGRKAYSPYNEKGERLAWEPIFATISRAGDLGCTTGPWNFRASASDEKPTEFGEFVSIWKVQPDKSWKVVVDFGIDHSTPTEPPSHLELLLPEIDHDVATEIANNRFENAKHSLEEGLKNDAATAMISAAADRIRVLRQNQSPAVGKVAAKVLLASDHAKITRQDLGGQISRSGDLAYSYGSYSIKDDASGLGHFLSVWKLDRSGDWKLLLDVQKKAQPKSSQ
jgi:ketosteroid isomerase-like protein